MDTSRQKLWCTFYKKKGHQVDNCRKKLGLCIKCGEKGHFAKDCPKGFQKVREVETTASIEEVLVDVGEDFQEPQ